MSALDPSLAPGCDLDRHSAPIRHVRPSSTLVPLYPSPSSRPQADFSRSTVDQNPPLLLFCVVCRQFATWFSPLRPSHQPPLEGIPSNFDLSSAIPQTPTSKSTPIWISGQIHGVCAQCEALTWLASRPYQSFNQNTPSRPSRLHPDSSPSDNTPLSPCSESSASVISTYAPLKLNRQGLEADAGSISSLSSSSQSGSLNPTKPFRLSFAAPSPMRSDSNSSEHSSLNQLEILKGSNLGFSATQQPVRLELPPRQKPRRVTSSISNSEIKEILDTIPEGPNSSSRSARRGWQRSSSGSLNDLREAFSGSARSSQMVTTPMNTPTIDSTDSAARLRSLLRQAKIPPPDSDQSSVVYQDHMRKSFDIWESELLSAARERRTTPMTTQHRLLNSGSEDSINPHRRGYSGSSNCSQLQGHVLSPSSANLTGVIDGDRGFHDQNISQASSFRGASFDEERPSGNRLKDVFHLHRPSLLPDTLLQSGQDGSCQQAQRDLLSVFQRANPPTPMYQSQLPIAPPTDTSARRGSSQCILSRLMINTERPRKSPVRRPSLSIGPLSSTVSSLARSTRSSISGHSRSPNLTPSSFEIAATQAARDAQLDQILSGRQPSLTRKTRKPSRATELLHEPSSSQPGPPRLNESFESVLPNSQSTRSNLKQSVFSRLMVKTERGDKESKRQMHSGVESPTTFTTSKLFFPINGDNELTSIPPENLNISRPSQDSFDLLEEGDIPDILPLTITSNPFEAQSANAEVVRRDLRETSSPASSSLQLTSYVDLCLPRLEGAEENGKQSAAERRVALTPTMPPKLAPKASILNLVRSPNQSNSPQQTLSLPPEDFESSSGKVSMTMYPRPSSDTLHPGQRLTVYVRLKSETKRKIEVVISGQFVDQGNGTRHEFLKVVKPVTSSDGKAELRPSGTAVEEWMVDLVIPEYGTCRCSPGPLPLPSSGINLLGEVFYTIQLLVKKKELYRPKDTISIKLCFKAATDPSEGINLLTQPKIVRSSSNRQIALDPAYLGFIEDYSLSYQFQYSRPDQLEIIYGFEIRFGTSSTLPKQMIDYLANAVHIKLKYQVGDVMGMLAGVVDTRAPGWQMFENRWMIKGSLRVTDLTPLASRVPVGSSGPVRLRKKAPEIQFNPQLSIVVTVNDAGSVDRFLGGKELELSSVVGTGLLSSCALRNWGLREVPVA